MNLVYSMRRRLSQFGSTNGSIVAVPLANAVLQTGNELVFAFCHVLLDKIHLACACVLDQDKLPLEVIFACKVLPVIPLAPANWWSGVCLFCAALCANRYFWPPNLVWSVGQRHSQEENSPRHSSPTSGVKEAPVFTRFGDDKIDLFQRNTLRKLMFLILCLVHFVHADMVNTSHIVSRCK